MNSRARRRGHARALRRRVLSVAACGVLVAGTSAGCFAEPSAMPTVRDFLIAWEVGNYEAASKLTIGADQRSVENTLGQVRSQLDAASMKLALGVPVKSGKNTTDAIVKKGESAEARFSVKFDLGENGQPWTYTGHMRLKRVGGKWKVLWDPSIIHPQLKNGQRLAVVSEAPPRAAIQDVKSRSLLSQVQATLVGVTPGRLSDPKRTLDQLTRVTRQGGGRALDVERLLGRVRSAPPERFLPLMTLQHSLHASLIKRLCVVPGLVCQNGLAPIGAKAAPELVGTLGPATSDKLQQVGAPYQPGDTIGTSGLQLYQQRRLGGTPVVRVIAQSADGEESQQLISWDGQPPQAIRTTLTASVQLRADKALADLKHPASLVVLKDSTGEILGVSNHGTRGRNLAMEGRYQPGMTFGIVTAEALLRTGVSQNTKTDCPATATVGGQSFTNPGGPRPQQTLQRNFAYGCATTLAQLSSKVDANALVAAAGRFGLGKDWGLNVPAFSGAMTAPAGDAEKAATAIGQGKVQVSPLAMAGMAAAVESGTWKPPYLLNDPRPVEVPPALPMDSAAISELQQMLQRSVVSGTAKAANVGNGGTVRGVSTTVTYQESGRPKTVSWFVGSRGGEAFAIAVEGKVDAAQIAAKFLTGSSSAATPGSSAAR